MKTATLKNVRDLIVQIKVENDQGSSVVRETRRKKSIRDQMEAEFQEEVISGEDIECCGTCRHCAPDHSKCDAESPEWDILQMSGRNFVPGSVLKCDMFDTEEAG